MTNREPNERVADSPALGNGGDAVSPHERRIVLAIVAAAVAARVLAALVRPDSLGTDPDGYVRLAKSVVVGDGLVDAEGRPSAFRPPLYPLLLTGPVALLGSRAGVLVLNLVLSAVLVAVTWWWGRRVFGPLAGLLAAAVVAFDPLLVLYTLQPMTEVPFALLTTLLLALLQWVRTRENRGEPTTVVWALAGIVFGLAALCRPTIWAWLVVVLLPNVSWAVVAWLRAARSPASSEKPGFYAWPTGWVPFLVSASLVVLPWAVRNTLVLGRPVFTTTHGGYTLLLANNPVFYDEVVRQPWGTVWGRESLDDWQTSLEDAMAAEKPPVEGELARDRWLRRRAVGHVTADPLTFARSCYVRVLRFWNPAPLVASIPRPVYWGVTFLYAVVFGLAVGGMGFASVREQSRLWPAVALVVALTAVHAVFWSNARMRAPLTPVVALFAACGATRFLSARTSP